MSSLLSTPVSSRFAPTDRVTIKACEIAAHRAVMSMVDVIRNELPEHLSHIAPSIALIGITSAAARILAQSDRIDDANKVAANMTRTLQAEMLHWRLSRLLH